MKFELSDLVAIQDSREQAPLNLAPMRMEVAGLDTGDYSVKGYQDYIRIERKSLSDLVQCVGRERERFDREMVRLRGFRFCAVVVEGNWRDVMTGDFGRSRVHPNAVMGSCHSWQRRGVPIMFLGNPVAAASWVRGYMFNCAREITRLASLYAHKVKEDADA